MCSKRAKILVQKLGPKYDKAVIDCLNSSIGIQTTGIIRPMEDVVQKVVMFSAKNKPENMHLRDENSFWKERIKLDFREKRIRCRISSHPYTGIPILWCKSKHKTLLPMAFHHYICDIFNLSSDIQIKYTSKDITEFPDTKVVDNLKEYGKSLPEDENAYRRFLMISRKDILDCTQGMDIERESDGMLATTMIDDDEFRFYVWHERFPDPSKTQPISYTRMSRNPLFYTGSVQF
uniref:FBA_2 domain-containing protein n=1 Tax=Caenorhabditis tropicalis TaxID=1561998 RepID=A0A1I7T3U1_9PELO